MRQPTFHTRHLSRIDHFPRRAGWALLLLLALLVLPATAPRAEDGASDGPLPADLTDMAIEQLMGIEVDTVSGASRYEQPINEAPASVTIITADEISWYGYRSLADILQSVPGFSIINDRNYQYAGVRGFGLPGDYGNRMLILVDGVRQNDPVYSAAHLGYDFVMDVDLIERVEVIRGPGHTLYGANAMQAVVNVVTKGGRDLSGVELSADAGSFATYKGRLSYGARINGDLELLLSGTLLDSHGQDLYYREFAAPDSNFGWARNADREWFGSAFLKLAYRDLTLTGAYVNREKRIPTAPWGTVFNNPGTEATDRSMFLDLNYNHAFADGTDLMTRVSWNSSHYDGSYVYDWADPGDPPQLVNNVDKTRSTWLTGEVQASTIVAERHRLIGGLEFRSVLRSDQKNYDMAVRLDDRRSSWNVGFFLQDEYQVLDNLILNVGLRYDHFDTFGGTLNPRVGLIYTPVSRTSIKLLYGSAFRPPNDYELYYNDNSATQKANPGLKEESSSTCELIFEQYLGKKFRGTLSGYYTWVKDLITLTSDPVDDLLVFRNITKAELRGIEFTLDKTWDNGMQGTFSYSFQDSKDTTSGERLANSARHLLKARLVLPLVTDKLFLGLEEQYTGSKQILSGGTTDGYFVSNLTLFSRNLLHNLELSGSIYNLFNSGYAVPAGGEHRQETIRQDGRIFRIKATWRF